MKSSVLKKGIVITLGAFLLCSSFTLNVSAAEVTEVPDVYLDPTQENTDVLSLDDGYWRMPTAADKEAGEMISAANTWGVSVDLPTVEEVQESNAVDGELARTGLFDSWYIYLAIGLILIGVCLLFRNKKVTKSLFTLVLCGVLISNSLIVHAEPSGSATGAGGSGSAITFNDNDKTGISYAGGILMTYHTFSGGEQWRPSAGQLYAGGTGDPSKVAIQALSIDQIRADIASNGAFVGYTTCQNFDAVGGIAGMQNAVRSYFGNAGVFTDITGATGTRSAGGMAGSTHVAELIGKAPSYCNKMYNGSSALGNIASQGVATGGEGIVVVIPWSWTSPVGATAGSRNPQIVTGANVRTLYPYGAGRLAGMNQLTNAILSFRSVTVGGCMSINSSGQLLPQVSNGDPSGAFPENGYALYSGGLQNVPAEEVSVTYLDPDLELYDYNLNYVYYRGIGAGVHRANPITIMPNIWTYYAGWNTLWHTPAGWEKKDNWVPNPNLTDTNGDGIGDTPIPPLVNQPIDDGNKPLNSESSQPVWGEDAQGVPNAEAEKYKIVVTESDSGDGVASKASSKHLLLQSPYASFTTHSSALSGAVFQTNLVTETAPNATIYREDNNGSGGFGGSNYSIDYAYNLTREIPGDIRNISGITETESTPKVQFAKSIVGMSYGTSQSTGASGHPHNSFDIIAQKFSQYQFNFRFLRTGATRSVHSVNGPIWDSKNIVYFSQEHCHYKYDPVWGNEETFYQSVVPVPVSAASNQITVKFNETYYKYTTVAKAQGVNNIGSNFVFGVHPTLNNGYLTGNVNTNYYSYGVKVDGVTTLNFVPEVPMLEWYYDPNTEVYGGHSPQIVRTMGEEMRSADSTSLYIMQLRADQNSVRGEVFSDGMAAGSRNANGVPTVYAGSDIQLTLKNTYTINCYGYAIDVLNSGLDSTVYHNGASSYTSVVKNGDNVGSNWGNDGNKDALFADYANWVSTVTTPDAYAAEISLQIGSGTNGLYIGLPSSIGQLTAVTNHDDGGSYLIEVKQGRIVETGNGYGDLMAQIQSDLSCDLATAQLYFQNSGMYTSIINAVESVNDPGNASQPNGRINGSGHWYDEEVNTVVVRRFYTNPVSMPNITCNDKIDYDATPRQTSRNSVGVTGVSSTPAEWYFTLYWKDPAHMYGFQDFASNYDGSHPNDTALFENYNQGTVLLHKVHVKAVNANRPASFRVTTDTTSDMDESTYD